MDKKTCSKCKESLPLTLFNKNGSGTIRPECNNCRRLYNKIRYNKRNLESPFKAIAKTSQKLHNLSVKKTAHLESLNKCKSDVDREGIQSLIDQVDAESHSLLQTLKDLLSKVVSSSPL